MSMLSVVGFTEDSDLLIPKIVHFIWVKNPLPSEYADNIINIATLNPQYQIKIWTDSADLLPQEKLQNSATIEVRFMNELMKALTPYLQEIIIKELQDELGQLANAAVASDILRVAALKLYGGIYLDTDIFKEEGASGFGDLRAPYGFLILNNESSHGMASNYRVDNPAIASTKNHPVTNLLLEEFKKSYTYCLKNETYKNNNKFYFSEDFYDLVKNLNDVNFWVFKKAKKFTYAGKSTRNHYRIALETYLSGPAVYYDVVEYYFASVVENNKRQLEEPVFQKWINDFIIRTQVYTNESNPPAVKSPDFSFNIAAYGLFHRRDKTWH